MLNLSLYPLRIKGTTLSLLLDFLDQSIPVFHRDKKFPGNKNIRKYHSALFGFYEK
jgi:hypothetical protein